MPPLDELRDASISWCGQLNRLLFRVYIFLHAFEKAHRLRSTLTSCQIIFILDLPLFAPTECNAVDYQMKIDFHCIGLSTYRVWSLLFVWILWGTLTTALRWKYIQNVISAMQPITDGFHKIERNRMVIKLYYRISHALSTPTPTTPQSHRQPNLPVIETTHNINFNWLPLASSNSLHTHHKRKHFSFVRLLNFSCTKSSWNLAISLCCWQMSSSWLD